MREILKKKRNFDWLTPPMNPHWLTVQDVIKAKTAEEHLKIIREWAKSVYEAWSHHHETIKNIIIMNTDS